MSGDRLLLHFYSHSKQRSISEKNSKQFLSNLIGSFYRFLFSRNIYTNEIVIILFLISGMIECSALKKLFFLFKSTNSFCSVSSNLAGCMIVKNTLHRQALAGHASQSQTNILSNKSTTNLTFHLYVYQVRVYFLGTP